jgi:hypothetical protein
MSREVLNELKRCFREDFTEWLLKRNLPKVGPHLSNELHTNMRLYVEGESLKEILNVLLREPLADYFWYGYPEHGGELSYSLPHHEVVPGDSLRVDGDKIKVFLRNVKLNSILDEL